tara:strand:- start:1275 stop:1430 length:156 start_codon:yes stop_codon:yes gene_type:complete
MIRMMIKAIPKSTNFDKTGTKGITNLGKYTLVIIPVELNRLLVDSLSELEK